MRKVPSKARKYSLNEFTNNNKSIDNIGGRVLGGLFRERYGDLYNKFKYKYKWRNNHIR